jgi:beta-catenin-like protein 1
MENLFDTLCSALSEPSIKALFLQSEGVDLMVLMMKYALLHSHEKNHELTL